MKVSDAIKILQGMPPDRTIACQVVDHAGKAWNMLFEFNDVPASDWMVQLRVWHPELKSLPDSAFGETAED